MHDLDRQGAEVVQAGKLDLAGVIHLLDPGHERNPDSVAELHPVEAELLDLAQHLVALGMATRIPAGGESKHRRAEVYTVATTGGGLCASSMQASPDPPHSLRTRLSTNK